MASEGEVTVRNWDGSLLIDVSNVCRSTSPPSWEVLGQLLEIWSEEFGRPSRILPVADNSLRHIIPGEPNFAEQGASLLELRYVPKADDVILDVAHRLLEAGVNFAVVSSDRFVLEADAHPWLIGDRDHFFEFIDGPTGRQIKPRSMLMTLHTRTARKERATLAELGFVDGANDPRLARNYRCGTEGCWLHDLRPERLLGVPATESDGSLSCPGCGSRLIDAGPAPLRRRLIVDGDVEKTFLVEAETFITVGRTGNPLRRTLGLDQFDLPPKRLKKISRVHLEIALTGQGDVMLTNQSATNGTVIERRGRRGVSEGTSALALGETVRLSTRDRVLIAGVATLEISGERRPTTVPLASSR